MYRSIVWLFIVGFFQMGLTNDEFSERFIEVLYLFRSFHFLCRLDKALVAFGVGELGRGRTTAMRHETQYSMLFGEVTLYPLWVCGVCEPCEKRWRGTSWHRKPSKEICFV